MGYFKYKDGRVTLRQLAFSSPMAWGLFWLVVVFFVGMGIFGMNMRDANKDYTIQRDALSAIRQLETPAERQLYAKALLQGSELTDRRSYNDAGLGDKLASQLRIVVETGEVPAQNNRLHTYIGDFWHGLPVWVCGAAAYIAFSLCLLYALAKIAEQQARTMVGLLPWKYGWPFAYALLVAINPIGLVTLAASAKSWYAQTHPRKPVPVS